MRLSAAAERNKPALGDRSGVLNTLDHEDATREAGTQLRTTSA